MSDKVLACRCIGRAVHTVTVLVKLIEQKDRQSLASAVARSGQVCYRPAQAGMDYDSYDSASEIAYSEDSGDTGDYGFDGGADEQPRARQVRRCQTCSPHATAPS